MAFFFSFAAVVIALIGYVAFQQWLRHHRRVMIHRERLAALEKGVELPPLEQEIRRGGWNVQRLLLLMGLCWIAIGIGTFAVLGNLAWQDPINIPWDAGTWVPVRVNPGLQALGIAPLGIGIAHLIVYFVGRNKDA
jgi:hypothetical protein